MTATASLPLIDIQQVLPGLEVFAVLAVPLAVEVDVGGVVEGGVVEGRHGGMVSTRARWRSRGSTSEMARRNSRGPSNETGCFGESALGSVPLPTLTPCCDAPC